MHDGATERLTRGNRQKPMLFRPGMMKPLRNNSQTSLHLVVLHTRCRARAGWLKRAGYALWLIAKGDLIRQAIKLSCFPFLNRFEVVEIVDRKNACVYRRVLAANSCPPDMFERKGAGAL